MSDAPSVAGGPEPVARGPELLAAALAYFERQGVPVRVLSHAPARSTAHIAELRGAPVSLGCKALLMKAGGAFVIVALRAHRALDSRALRRELGVQRLRFASADELLALTGCVPGQLPPLGHPVLDLPLVADAGVLAMPELAFTAGTHTSSVCLSSADWARVMAPRVLSFRR